MRKAKHFPYTLLLKKQNKPANSTSFLAVVRHFTGILWIRKPIFKEKYVILRVVLPTI